MSGGIRFWRWTVACGLAEFLGIALAALWWVLIDRIEPQPVGLPAQLSLLGLKGASGIVEGAILGVVQATALRRGYPALSRRAWVTATMILACVGWVIGSAPSILFANGGGDAGPGFDPSLPQVILFAGLFGLAVGALFGAAQWLALRRAARRAGWWILANMVGWMIALPAIYVAASTGSAVPAISEVVLRGLGGGLAAGLLLGALTYPFLSLMPAISAADAAR